MPPPATFYAAITMLIYDEGPPRRRGRMLLFTYLITRSLERPGSQKNSVGVWTVGGNPEYCKYEAARVVKGPEVHEHMQYSDKFAHPRASESPVNCIYRVHAGDIFRPSKILWLSWYDTDLSRTPGSSAVGDPVLLVKVRHIFPSHLLCVKSIL